MSEFSEIKALLESVDRRLQHQEALEAINRLIVDYARGADRPRHALCPRRCATHRREPYSLPRRVRPEQPASCAGDTGPQRLKRVFRIEIEICRHCEGTVLQIHRESGSSNASFHVYRRSAGGREATFR